MSFELRTYSVTVHDPEQTHTITYPVIAARNAEHAIQQAKDGYTGLLGNVEERQKKLQIVEAKLA